MARRFGLGILVAVLLLGMAFLTPGRVTAQSVTIDPGAAPAGATVTASGSGWASGVSVRVEWADGALLGDVAVDASGGLSVALVVPATATVGDYMLRFIAYVPPYVSRCTVEVVQVTFTVLPPGPTATPGTATATQTATGTETVSPTVVATQCATATGTTETPTGSTETPTGTTTVVATGTLSETVTATATFTPVVTATATTAATSTPTATATRTPAATATRTPTATATRTPTRAATATATRTPTRVGFPGTGSAGLLDQDADGSGGTSASLIVAVAVLGAGLTSAGVVVLRRRIV
ncbi:MAG: hypothetical protein M3439_02355 [Chloroflexota bacterium]|nr:hypothetical protein [Chloroflexota bacterium]